MVSSFEKKGVIKQERLFRLKFSLMGIAFSKVDEWMVFLGLGLRWFLRIPNTVKVTSFWTFGGKL